MRKARGYEVTVREMNEIAGERVTSDAVAFSHKSFAEAMKWALGRWGVNPPCGARIRDRVTGETFRIIG